MFRVSPVRLRYQVLAFTVVRTIINTAFRMVYPFLPAISRGLGVPIESITVAITLRATLGVFSPFIGSLADIRGRKTAILLGVGLFAVGMLLVTVWPTYPSLFVSLLLVGLSKIVFDPAMQAYLGDHVPYERRGLAIGLSEFGWSGAFLLGIPIVGWLIAQYGWNAPFFWLTLLGIGLIFLLWRILPVDRPIPGTQLSLRQGFRVVLSYPSALAGLVMALLINASNETVNIVYGLWLEDSFGLQIAALGVASAIIGIAELGGEGLVAGFVDRLGKRRAVGLGLLCYAAASLLLPALGVTETGAWLGLFLFYLSYEFTLVSTIPLMTELAPGARATLLASNVAAFSLGRALGSLIGPALYVHGLPANTIAAALMNLASLALLIIFIREASSHQ